MVYSTAPMVLSPVLTEQVVGWFPEAVWTLSKSEISLGTAVNGKLFVRPPAHRLVTASATLFPPPRVEK